MHPTTPPLFTILTIIVISKLPDNDLGGTTLLRYVEWTSGCGRGDERMSG